MKKLVLTLVAGAFISASMISCNKCGTCEFNGVTSGAEICQKDNKAAYDAYKTSCEANGGEFVTK